MLQRIQSLYLLVSFFLLTLTLITPLAEFISNAGDAYNLSSVGLYPREINDQANLILRSNYILLFINVLVLTLIGIVIFFYKRRIIQIRLLFLVIGLLLAYYGLFLLYFKNALTILNTDDFSFKAVIIFPVVSLILVYMAIVAIRKDDKLVKSVDRLR